MGLPFTALFERRDSLENPSTDLWRALTQQDTPTAAGLTVSDEKALSVPAVFACVQVLAQDLAKTPTKLRRLIAPDTYEDVTDHVLVEVLHSLPNPETTSYEFKYQMMFQLLKHSRAYAEIQRNARGQVVGLWPLESSRMTIDRDALNRKRYTYALDSGQRQQWTFNPDTPPILELRWESPIQRCRDLIGFAAALELYGAKFFANGARLSGILSTDLTLNDLQAKNLRESFESFYKGAANAFKVAVLQNGMKYTPMAAPNNEAQLNEIQKYVRTVIAGAFRVPPHKIGDLERATFSNIEHQAIEYVTGTLDPFYVAWEQAVRRDLLTTRQYASYDIVFDREAMIRADIKSRMDAYAVARQNGWMNADQIRKKLGENVIGAEEGGSVYLVNGNMVPVVSAGSKPPAPPATGEGAAA